MLAKRVWANLIILIGITTLFDAGSVAKAFTSIANAVVFKAGAIC